MPACSTYAYACARASHVYAVARGLDVGAAAEKLRALRARMTAQLAAIRTVQRSVSDAELRDYVFKDASDISSADDVPASIGGVSFDDGEPRSPFLWADGRARSERRRPTALHKVARAQPSPHGCR